MESTENDDTAKDTLGRRVAPRRFRTVEERRQIVEEAMAPGASVAGVARRHEVNANQVFVWRRQYQQGLLQVPGTEGSTEGSPRDAADPIGTFKRITRRRSPAAAPSETDADFLELELASGDRVRVHGKAATQLLERLIESLCRR
jgi:transposase